MRDTDAYQSFGLEMALRVENQSRTEGDDLDAVRFRRVGDDFTACGAESVLCRVKLAIPDREHGIMVSFLCVEIEIESCVDSPLTWRNARRSHIHHVKVERCFIACVIPRKELASVVALVSSVLVSMTDAEFSSAWFCCEISLLERRILNSSSGSALGRPTRSSKHCEARNLM
jgi:hypothetical protein